MANIENIKKAIEISKNLSDDNTELSDVVCIASHMIAICLSSYGLKGKLLDGALGAINEDIKNSMKAVDSIVCIMQKSEA